MTRRYWYGILFMGIMAQTFLPFSTYAEENYLQDVVPDTETEQAVEFLIIRGGVEPKQKQFRGEEQNTRVAFLKMLTATLPEDEYMKKKIKEVKLKFTDLEEGQWYIPTIKKAVYFGILENTESSFLPASMVKRGDALLWTFRAYGIPTPKTVTSIQKVYRDVLPQSFYRDAVGRALKYGLLAPVAENRFGVVAPLTREESALVIYRTHQLSGAIQNINLALPKEEETPLDDMLDTALIKQVWDQLGDGYLFEENIDKKAMSYGAVKGMVEALGDPFTVYLPPVETEEFKEELEGGKEGIGSYIDIDPRGIIIQAVIPGAPAEKAGLMAGDVITAVDGKSVTGLSTEQVANMIRGPKGTKVTLQFLRSGKSYTLEVVRDAFQIQTVVAVWEGQIVRIQIADFRDTTAAEFQKVVDEIKVKKPETIILDLRNNPGGYLGSSLEIVQHFFKKDQVLAYVETTGLIEEYTADREGEILTTPVYVLVNEHTASASEIVAGALQDTGRGKIIGATHSYGKGTVQELRDFGDGSALKITIAKWLTPSKRWVNEWTDKEGNVYKGLRPDMMIILDKPAVDMGKIKAEALEQEKQFLEKVEEQVKMTK